MNGATGGEGQGRLSPAPGTPERAHRGLGLLLQATLQAPCTRAGSPDRYTSLREGSALILFFCMYVCVYVCARMHVHICPCVHSVAKTCLTLCDLNDCSLPGSSVHGILQTRILEWVAISSSRGSSRPRDRTCTSSMGRHILFH